MSKHQQTGMRTRKRNEEQRRRSHGLRRFCDADLVVMVEGECPKCTRRHANFERYCRTCVTVHWDDEPCVPWTPKG